MLLARVADIAVGIEFPLSGKNGLISGSCGGGRYLRESGKLPSSVWDVICHAQKLPQGPHS